ncbi:MAG: alpha/beta hydrolase, partial [Pseudomonadota bacterium]
MTVVKWVFRGIAALIIGTGMAACSQLGLDYASLETEGKPPAWPTLQPSWIEGTDAGQEAMKTALETHVFGPVPVGVKTRLVSERIVDAAYANGAGTLVEYLLAVGEFEGERRFNLAVAYPNGADGPVPVLINQTFCTNRLTFDTNALTASLSPIMFCGDDVEEGAAFSVVAEGVFGRHIATPPNERILRRGYALASFYASELIADDGSIGRSHLNRFPSGERGRPTGAVAGWAAGYFAALDLLEADPRIDPDKTAIIGHSRHAKSALVAGAFDPRIEAVIAHQAGTGGSALSRFKLGESVAAITADYPHWFDPTYAAFDERGPFTTPADMHMLIALNAPRKLLLGNGRRDVWSDPNGSYRAALTAHPAWTARGAKGLTQSGMRDLKLDADLVF